MPSVTDFIETLKREPEHVRRRYALGASGVLTALIAVFWAMTLTGSGVLALGTAAPASAVLPDSGKQLSNLAGAANAFSTNVSNAASITVVDTKASSTLDARDATDDRTVIPF